MTDKLIDRRHGKLLLDMIASGCFPSAAGLWHVTVYHDDGCGIFTGKACDCDPEVKLTAHDYTYLCGFCRRWATIIPDSGELRIAYNNYLWGLGVPCEHD